MTEVTLGPARLDHLTDVLALLRECALPETGVREGLTHFTVAHAGSSLVGCCGLELYGSDALVRSLAVADVHRGRRIATALLGVHLERAREAGLSGLFLLTTTAREYFERFGFRALSRDAAPPGIRGSWEFRTGCPDTAVFMGRPLR